MIYPKWKHCSDGTSILVLSEAQEAALVGPEGFQWSDTCWGPVDGPKVVEVAPEPVPDAPVNVEPESAIG